MDITLVFDDATQGYALYVEGELTATWTNNEQKEYIDSQVALFAGTKMSIEETFLSAPWPQKLPKAPKPKAAPKSAPVSPSAATE